MRSARNTTFSNFSSNLTSDQRKRNPGNPTRRALELYAHGRINNQLKRDKTPEEMDYERNIAECSFQPKILFGGKKPLKKRKSSRSKQKMENTENNKTASFINIDTTEITNNTVNKEVEKDLVNED